MWVLLQRSLLRFFAKIVPTKRQTFNTRDCLVIGFPLSVQMKLFVKSFCFNKNFRVTGTFCKLQFTQSSSPVAGVKIPNSEFPPRGSRTSQFVYYVRVLSQRRQNNRKLYPTKNMSTKIVSGNHATFTIQRKIFHCCLNGQAFLTQVINWFTRWLLNEVSGWKRVTFQEKTMSSSSSSCVCGSRCFKPVTACNSQVWRFKWMSSRSRKVSLPRFTEILVTEKKTAEQCFLFVLAQTPNRLFLVDHVLFDFRRGAWLYLFLYYSKVYKLYSPSKARFTKMKVMFYSGWVPSYNVRQSLGTISWEDWRNSRYSCLFWISIGWCLTICVLF